LSGLAFCNPFLPERIEFERAVLGPDLAGTGPVWSAPADEDGETPNLLRLREKCEALAAAARERLARGASADARELELYEDVVYYTLYYRMEPRFYGMIRETPVRKKSGKAHPEVADWYTEFESAADRFFGVIPGRPRPCRAAIAHLFACCFQVRRAFHHTFRSILGRSPAVAELRAAVWQSVFTHDMRRYRRSLFRRMGDFSVLITGPSGTGKELVAQAIGLSRYIPFDPEKRRFDVEWREQFFPLNISALSPTLIESELFGHCRGAFTGAAADHVGWVEKCGPYGTVFLDEIGDVAAEVQVKLLRLLEARTFSRLGETRCRPFQGKVIAATNRDLPREMDAGRFRRDLYYRLCADTIRTPPLQRQLEEAPEDLETLVLYLARRLVGPDEAQGLAEEAVDWIRRELGPAYPWPGNVRELDQCVRNILIHRRFDVPAAAGSTPDPLDAIRTGALSADELLNWYCNRVFEQTGSYSAAARRLGLDRRTVKARVNAARTAGLTAAP